MTIALIIAILNAVASLVAHVAGRGILCGFHIALTLVFILSAVACEGKTLNRIKKLENELNNLRGE